MGKVRHQDGGNEMEQVRYTKEANTFTVWVGNGIIRACWTERQAKGLVAKMIKAGF